MLLGCLPFAATAPQHTCRVLMSSTRVGLSGVCSMYPIACRTNAWTACIRSDVPFRAYARSASGPQHTYAKQTQPTCPVGSLRAPCNISRRAYMCLAHALTACPEGVQLRTCLSWDRRLDSRMTCSLMPGQSLASNRTSSTAVHASRVPVTSSANRWAFSIPSSVSTASATLPCQMHADSSKHLPL